jgi:membrane-bound serine protease (ClpP class)
VKQISYNWDLGVDKRFMRSAISRWVGRLSIIGMGLLTALGLNGPSFAQQPPVVYVAPVEGIIDLGLAPFVQRVLNEATDAGAAAVIFEINTFGGGWTRLFLSAMFC